MQSGKHIVVLTPGFPADEGDTSCIPPVQEFLKTYRRRYPDDRITVISFQYPYITGKTLWHGIEVWNCGGKNKRIRKLFTWKKARSYFKYIHQKNPVNVIHAFWLGECAMIGHQLAGQYKIPLLITLMGQDVLAGNSYLNKPLLKNYPAIALSKIHAETYYKNTGKKAAAIIPWGIHAIHTKKENKLYDVIGAGNLIPLKNYSLFIDIIATLKKTRPEIRSILVGGGPEKNMLEQKIKLLGLEKNIQMAGLKKREEVMEYMSRSKVFLHTSSYESFGYVFSEALACGNTIVSLNVGWAEPSGKWLIAGNNSELVTLAGKALEQDDNSAGEIPFSASETTEAYHEWYTRLAAQ